MRLSQVCKPWRRELEARGFCRQTVQLCSALAAGGDAKRLGQNARRRQYALRRLKAGPCDDAERASACLLDGDAFLERSMGRNGSLHQWLQAASQEPDASFLSRGAASTAQALGLRLVRWVGKPQGLYALTGHSASVYSVAFSRDGKRVVSGSLDSLVKIWSTATGAEVRMLDCLAIRGQQAILNLGSFTRNVVWSNSHTNSRVWSRSSRMLESYLTNQV